MKSRAMEWRSNRTDSIEESETITTSLAASKQRAEQLLRLQKNREKLPPHLRQPKTRFFPGSRVYTF